MTEDYDNKFMTSDYALAILAALPWTSFVPREVPKKVIDARRAKNKVARRQRKINRHGR